MHDLITILGPTATGKTKLAAHLAAEINGEIISADSRQVYKGMDLGTGKDLGDYWVDGIEVPYHLVDIVEPGYEYNVYEFHRDFTKAFNHIKKKGKTPILCGGTGMYLDAAISGYKLNKVGRDEKLRSVLESMTDEQLIEKLKEYGELHNTTDVTNRQRTIRAIEIRENQEQNDDESAASLGINSINFGVYFEREEIRKKITERLKSRLDEGMVREVAGLMDKGLLAEQLMFYGLEYRYLTMYATGEIGFEEMSQKLNTAINQFAKRQSTWFRRMERKGGQINWIDGHLPLKEKVRYIKSVI